MKIGRWILVVLVLSIASAQAGRLYHAQQPPAAGAAEVAGDTIPGVRAPEGVRIKVEVLNASTVRGLARRSAMYLRDRGFDVVFVGSSSERSDTTLVLDRSGNPDWAELVAAAMGGTAVARPDTSRYLDVTVLVGASWQPPAGTFYP